MTTSNNQLSGWTEKRLEALSWKKMSWPLFGGLLLARSTTDFWILAKSLHLRSMLSKSTRSLNTAVAAAGIGQQEGSDFSQQCPIPCRTTSASKVERIGLWSFASSVIFIWPLDNQLLFLQASWPRFAGKTLPQAAGGRKCLQEFVEQTYSSLAKKCVDCKGYYVD